jgi:hypothetical protein
VNHEMMNAILTCKRKKDHTDVVLELVSLRRCHIETWIAHGRIDDEDIPSSPASGGKTGPM